MLDLLALTEGLPDAGLRLRTCNLRWFQVSEVRGMIDRGQVAHWQVTMKVGFTWRSSRRNAAAVSRRDLHVRRVPRLRALAAALQLTRTLADDPEQGDGTPAAPAASRKGARES